MWIYVLGERSGADIKIGHSKERTLQGRIGSVNGSQTRDESYVLLAGMLGSTDAEKTIKRYFQEDRREDKGRRTEYFWPSDPLIEYVLWLRAQWWTCFDEDVNQNEWEEKHHSEWVPTPERRAVRPTPDPDKLIQDYEQYKGPLAGTAWSWLPDPLTSFQDYFTVTRLDDGGYEAPIVERASQAMGGIDLDAASHWIANRWLHQAGIEIGDYFHVNRSAMEHDWVGRVWLNPPYGDNERWFARAIEMMDEGKLEQLCMVSPVWAFTTQIASEMTRRASAAVLLSPTPKFLNPADASRTGTNQPHAVFYWGDRSADFLMAYGDIGIPFSLIWNRVGV